MTEKKNRDLRVTFPPIGDDIGEPPLDPNEPPPRSGQKCANCNAFLTRIGPLGPESLCIANPPTPIFMGMGTTKTLNASGQPQQIPVVLSFWPPVNSEEWCRSWEWDGPGDGK